MKTPASRVESKDKQDILFLIDLLDLKTADEVSSIPEKYNPRQQIKPATRFFIKEPFESIEMKSYDAIQVCQTESQMRHSIQ